MGTTNRGDDEMTITLQKAGRVWAATFDCPRIVEVIGAEPVPTPFDATVPADRVLALVRFRNPGETVVLASEIPAVGAGRLVDLSV